MPLLLDLAYAVAALVYLPILLYQMIVLGKNRRGWRERFGLVPARPAGGPCVWIHAVSLGEVNAARSLVEEIERRVPGCEIVVSASTDTGHDAAYRLYSPRRTFRCPLDFSFAVWSALERLRPSAIVLMELEAWPNLVGIARRRGIPVGIANGRVTEEKSMRRFRMPVVQSVARRMFRGLSWVAAQEETYAARFRELGTPAERVFVAGNMKFDTAELADRVEGDAALAAAMGIDRGRLLIVAGSTGPGEEAMCLDAYAEVRRSIAGAQLALVPRKPERFEEVARLVESRGFRCVRRSRCSGESASGPACGPAGNGLDAVFLGDTMGELRRFYALASVVFVGRTLVPLGGSDLMEVAALARPMCFGPYVDNFAEAAVKLTAAGAAVQIGGPAELAPALVELLRNRVAAAQMGLRAREVVRQNAGATRRNADLLVESLRAVGVA